MNIEVARRRERGESHTMGLQLFLQKVHQNRFGIDANEFLAQHPVEQVDIASMNAEAIVHHREMTDAFSVEPIHGPHHVRSIEGMNEVSDDTVGLLSHVDFPPFIPFI